MKPISKEAFIRFLQDEQALRFGRFTLKSGMFSPFFINLGDIHSGRALSFVGRALAELIHEKFGTMDIVFGPPYKGIALASATALMYAQEFGDNPSILYNRKEAKSHGEKGMFVGKRPQKGQHIVVVDDVLSTGSTKVEAIRLLEETFTVKVDGVVVTVDRRTKDADSGLAGYALYSILDIPDLIEFLKNQNSSRAALLEQFYEGKYNG